MKKLEFKERDLLGGWQIEVRHAGHVLGCIRKMGSTGLFGYYKGRSQLHATLSDPDLESLKRRIAG